MRKEIDIVYVVLGHAKIAAGKAFPCSVMGVFNTKRAATAWVDEHEGLYRIIARNVRKR